MYVLVTWRGGALNSGYHTRVQLQLPRIRNWGYTLSWSYFLKTCLFKCELNSLIQVIKLFWTRVRLTGCLGNLIAAATSWSKSHYKQGRCLIKLVIPLAQTHRSDEKPSRHVEHYSPLHHVRGWLPIIQHDASISIFFLTWQNPDAM